MELVGYARDTNLRYIFMVAFVTKLPRVVLAGDPDESLQDFPYPMAFLSGEEESGFESGALCPTVGSIVPTTRLGAPFCPKEKQLLSGKQLTVVFAGVKPFLYENGMRRLLWSLKLTKLAHHI